MKATKAQAYLVLRFTAQADAIVFSILQPPPLPRIWAIVPLRSRVFTRVPLYHGGLLRGRAAHGLVGLMNMGHVNLTAADFRAVFAPLVFDDYGLGVPGLRAALRRLLREKTTRPVGFGAYASAADWPPL